MPIVLGAGSRLPHLSQSSVAHCLLQLVVGW